ncbi:TolC family protein [Paenibacillus sp.]|uniref:TolC family protein n=1 Tax=Paenibacillus sp. TaxID=58172 RepID=UPI002D3849EA|nr:TolC family protein [Paenibacillus sp.]HZG85645.1 TolC family protein [Paenibacillus sp.]
MTGRMMRRAAAMLAALALAAAIAPAAAFADEAAPAADKGPEKAVEKAVEELNIYQAIQRALARDAGLKAIGTKIALNEKRYEDELKKAKAAKGRDANVDSERIELRKQELLYPERRLAAIAELKRQQRETANRIEAEVAELYYRIQSASRQAKAYGAEARRLEGEAARREAQVKAGVTTPDQLYALRNALADAQAALQQWQRSEASARLSLNVKLGFEPERRIALGSLPLPEETLRIDDIDALAAKLLSASPAVLKRDDDARLARLEAEIVDRHWKDKRPEALDGLLDQAIEAELRAEDERWAVELKLRTDYDRLLNLEDQVRIKRAAYERAELLARAAEARHKAGLDTESKALEAKSALLQAENAWEQARIDYRLALLRFNHFIAPATAESA